MRVGEVFSRRGVVAEWGPTELSRRDILRSSRFSHMEGSITALWRAISKPFHWGPVSTLLLAAVLLILFFSRWLPHGGLPALAGDSGMFLYIGQQVSNGLAPYTDVWDHKPPLIFYANAFALRIAHGSPRGIVYLACVSTFAFCTLVWAALRRRAGVYAALFSVILVIGLLPDLVLSPNLTELFSLPFQAACFLLMAREVEAAWEPRYAILQGLLGAALFQLRANNAVVTALYVAVCAYDHFRARSINKFFGQITVFGIAFAIGNAACLWPIIQQGHLRQYWDAAFGFNAQYSSQRPIIMHFYAVGVGILKTSRFGGCALATAMAFAALRARLSWSRIADRFGILAVALLALEVCASAVSGMAFEHYFLTWLLPIGLLAGLFIRYCGELIGSRAFSIPAFAGACTLLVTASLFDGAREFAQCMAKFRDPQADAVRYVRERCASSDRAFVWASYGDLAFRLGLKPASRFFSTVPMSHDAETYRAQATEALHDVEHSKPRFILEAPGAEQSSSLQGSLPRLFSVEPEPAQWDSMELRSIKGRLAKRYSLVYQSGSGVKVYEWKASTAQPRMG